MAAGQRLIGRHPTPQPIQTKKQQWLARFGGPFLYKKSLHGFMQARQLCLDPVPVYGFFWPEVEKYRLYYIL